MRLSGPFLLLIFLIPSAIAQAPGDEDTRCTDTSTYRHTYPDNWKVLMDSWNYEQLLPGHSQQLVAGAVWTDVSLDSNDNAPSPFITPPYWQHGAGGICRWQAQVCGHEVGPQNNWLFTQHISKDIDDERNNYPVDVFINITFSFQSCRERSGCNPQFKVYHYITTPTPDYQTTSNYEEIETILSSQTDSLGNEILTFQLQPEQMGFYLAIQDFDEGTCVGINRVLVYRQNCQDFQTGLVLYPDTPAPRSGSVSLNITCADDASVVDSANVTCQSNGMWGSESPECRCNPGYEFNSANRECDICPERTYQARLSNTEQCKPCPAQSFSDEPGTAVCPCICDYIRHPDRPGDACSRPPSAPGPCLANPTELSEGTVLTLYWLPSADTGGAPNLHYNVYATQLNSSNPVYEKVNSKAITKICRDGCHCDDVRGLDAEMPYSLLVVAANDATNDPSSFSDVSILGGRFLVVLAKTEKRQEKSAGLSAGTAAGITFILTLVFTAVVTALITLAIVYLVLKGTNTFSSSSSRTHTSHAGGAAYKASSGRDSVDIKNSIYNPTNPDLSEDVEHPSFTAVKPPPPSRPVPPSRPATAPPKPAVTSRPPPPSRPSHNPPKPPHTPQYRPRNGY